MRRLYQLLFPTLVLLALAIPVHANDCGSVHAVTSNTTSALYTFDGTCDFEDDMPSQRVGVPQNCTGEVWFSWTPGSANTTIYNMDFEVTANNNCVVNIFLLYSESKDAVNPCYWNAGNLFNPTSWGLTGYQSVGGQALTAGTPFSLNVSGLDGSGTFFIVVEKVSGAGNQVSLAPMLNSTNASAANDRCMNAIQLTTGNGIDPNAQFGAIGGNWLNGAGISSANGTKMRLQAYCTGTTKGPATEDHYSRYYLISCFPTGNLGDAGLVPIGTQSIPSLQNTTFYNFTAPATANDFHIHFSSTSQCNQEPNAIYAMIYGPGFNCGNAELAVNSFIAAQQITVSGSGLGSVDYAFPNVSMTAGQTYWIVLDGVRGSQCDVEVLITRGMNSPLLPVTLSYFTGQHRAGINQLSWETESEDLHDKFMIQRSTDGETYERIAEISSNGGINQRTTYSYDDFSSPIGRSFYRLEMIDINGGITFSDVVELRRIVENFSVLGLVPNPATETTDLLLSSPAEISASIGIFDLQGKQLSQQMFKAESGEHKVSLNLRALSSGLYLVKVSTDRGSYTEKLIVR